jgi:ribosomal protein S12 methylthiotransferase accessory factor YcaO
VGAGRRFQDVPSQACDDFRDEVEWELERLRRAGLREVIVTDLTNPAFGLPVARVVIPGLEGPVSVSGGAPRARARRFRADAT